MSYRQMSAVVRRLWLYAAASICLLGGCTGDRMVPAAGNVTLDGQPLVAATVVLVPEAGGLPATGFTDAHGHFELQTGNADGAMPGAYVAVVSKDELAAPTTATSEQTAAIADTAGKTIDELSDEELGRVMTQLTPTPRTLVTPARYATAGESPLRCKITSTGERSLMLELHSPR